MIPGSGRRWRCIVATDQEKELTAIRQIDEEIRTFYESRVPSYFFEVAEPIRRSPN
jgi:hypothetical protein